jgi:hypothetical protein
MRGFEKVAVVLAAVLGCGDASEADEPTDADGGESTASGPTGGLDTSDDGSDVGSTTTLADESTGDTPLSDVDGGRPSPALWHIESPGDSARTWLVSPEGERVFWLGVNTVMRDKTCDGILDFIRRTDPTTAANVEWARLSTGDSGAEHNDAPYCFNSVAAFSDTNDFGDDGRDSWMIRAAQDGGAGAPYGIVISPMPRTDDGALRGEDGTVLRSGFTEVRVGDPWHPAFAADLATMVAEDVAPRVGDPRLQMWFVGNETGMLDRAGHGADGVRDFRRWLWTQCPDASTIDAPQCAPHALAGFLRTRYGTLAALNTAWESAYAGDDFVAIVEAGPRPVPYVHDCNQTCREDLQRFVHDELLRRWVELVTTTVRATDPGHLLASPRMALTDSTGYRFWNGASSNSPDAWYDEPGTPVPTDTDDVVYCPFDLLGRTGEAGFDLIAVNVYDGDPEFSEPWLGDGFAKLHERSGMPIVVSEFSVRARIDGWSNQGGAGSFVPNDDETPDQIQRGAYYRSQIEQFAAHPYVLGAAWHAWSDRYDASDPAHQIDMGLLQCDDPARGFVAGERWDEIDDRIADTNCTIMDRLAELTGL